MQQWPLTVSSVSKLMLNQTFNVQVIVLLMVGGMGRGVSCSACFHLVH
jgi:hypothetical protein